MEGAVRRLGPFRLLQPIGKGSAGEVWLARHDSRGEAVAIKLMRPEKTGSELLNQSFYREVQVIAGLSHPHICGVLDYGQLPDVETDSLLVGGAWIAMPFVPGGVLRAHRGVMPWGKLRVVVFQLLDALAHAHARGVVHRDVKPSNVLLSRSGGALLADFGLAQLVGDVPGGGGRMAVGTPSYMAPEQVEGRWRDLGPPADLYSMGSLVWEMVCGRPPFVGGNTLEVMRAQRQKPLPPFKPVVAVPWGLEAWLRRALKKDARERFPFAADAAHSWAELGKEAGRSPQALADPCVAVEVRTIMSAATVLSTAHTTRTQITKVSVPLPFEEEAPEFRSVGTAPPPLPDGGVEEALPRLRPQLEGVGLGLLGLRVPELTGRASRLAEISDRVTAVHQHRRPLVTVIEGPSGVGKGRLAQAACYLVHQRGWGIWLHGRHSPGAGRGEGVAAMLRSHFGCGGLSGEALLRRLSMKISELGLPGPQDGAALFHMLEPESELVATVGGLRSAGARHALFDRILAAIAGERLVVLWLESLHWSSSSAEWALHLLQNDSETRPAVMIVATIGAEAEREDGPLQSLLAHEGVHHIGLEPLATQHVVSHLRGILDLEDHLVAELASRSSGNLLFAEQLLADLLSRDALEPGPWGYALKSGAQVDLPDDLLTAWEARLSHLLVDLDPIEAQALELAAACGVHVDHDLWVVLAKGLGVADPDALVDRLLRLRLARTVAGAGERRWAFVHGMLREALTGREGAADRVVTHHGLWAEALETRPGSAHRERAARHRLRCGDLAVALDPLLRGALAYRWASDLHRSELLLSEVMEALEILGDDADPDIRLRCWLEVSMLRTVQCRYAESIEVAKRAEKLARALGRDDSLSLALARMSQAALTLGQSNQGLSWALQARSACKASIDPALVVTIDLAVGNAFVSRGDIPMGLQAYRKALKACEEHGLTAQKGLCHTNLAKGLLRVGELDVAAEHLAVAVPIFEAAGNRNVLSRCETMLGEIGRLQGNLDAAEAHHRRVLELSQGLGRTLGIATALANLGLIRLALADWPVAVDLFEQAAPRFDRLGMGHMVGSIECCLAQCSAETGNWEGAEKHLLEAGRHLTGAAFGEPDFAQAAERCADLALASGRPELRRSAALLAGELWLGAGRPDHAARIEQNL